MSRSFLEFPDLLIASTLPFWPLLFSSLTSWHCTRLIHPENHSSVILLSSRVAVPTSLDNIISATNAQFFPQSNLNFREPQFSPFSLVIHTFLHFSSSQGDSGRALPAIDSSHYSMRDTVRPQHGVQMSITFWEELADPEQLFRNLVQSGIVNL